MQQMAEANQQPQVPLAEVESRVADGTMDDAAVDRLKGEAHAQPQPQTPQQDEFDKGTLQNLWAGASQPQGTQDVLATQVEALAVPPEVPRAEVEVSGACQPGPVTVCSINNSIAWRNPKNWGMHLLALLGVQSGI